MPYISIKNIDNIEQYDIIENIDHSIPQNIKQININIYLQQQLYHIKLLQMYYVQIIRQQQAIIRNHQYQLSCLYNHYNNNYNNDLIEIGSYVTGIIIKITDYGIFIELNEYQGSGMVHVSNLNSNEYVNHPKDLFSIDDEVSVWFEGWKNGAGMRFTMIPPKN